MLPLVVGGLTRAGTILIAALALAFVVFVHVVRFTARSGRAVRSGPLAGLGPADVREVTHAVRKGEAVSEVRLAAPAAAYAGQLARWQSVSRILLPVIVALRAVDLIVDPPEGPARIAQAAVRAAALAVLSILSVVGYRRARESEERNSQLVAPG